MLRINGTIQHVAIVDIKGEESVVDDTSFDHVINEKGVLRVRPRDSWSHAEDTDCPS